MKSSVSPIIRFDGDAAQATSFRHTCCGVLAPTPQMRRLVTTLTTRPSWRSPLRSSPLTHASPGHHRPKYWGGR